MARTAILIIDIQIGLFQKPNPIYKEDEFLNNINMIEKFARETDIPLVYIQHDNKSFLLKNTEGWKLHPRLDYKNDDMLIYKSKGNAFNNTRLKTELEKYNIDSLIITGLVSQGCVRATCIGAKELGYNVILIEDGHSNYNKDANKIIKEVNCEMKKAEIYIVKTDQLINNQ